MGWEHIKMELSVYKNKDLSELRALWKICFGDTDAFLDAFFSGLYTEGSAVQAREGGELCSAMYIFDVGAIADSRLGELRCCYLYALGTMPKFRGRGIGAAVTMEAARLGFERGYDVCVTCPAEQSLFDYYRNMGFEDFSWASHGQYMPDLEGSAPGRKLMSTTLENYQELRKALAPPQTLAYSQMFLRFLCLLLSMSGGGLYTLELPGGAGLAAAAPTGKGGVIVKEIICRKEDADAAMKLIAGHFASKDISAVGPAGVLTEDYVNTLALYSDKINKDTLRPYFPFSLD